ncbi:methylenetetrahydrofolate reductase-domain-containing protein [Dipodascopsis tothii]|uniref:methylenetetrahydrofolate reductase-domain-containing protein n=1 Tax=Dipodascopsis tothii TaxID=44089 RepID=UPI0034CFBDC4
MAKISDKIAQLGPDETYFSFEFFPPKTEAGMQNLRARLQRMAQLKPLFVNITFGAGGSTSTKSLDLATLCTSELGLTTCLHLTCTNMDRSLIDSVLAGAKKAGIRNILALRGDPPRGTEYWTPDESSQFCHAVDLVRHIRREYGDYFCIGVASYPEGYADGQNPELQDPVVDLPYLVDKTSAGADFIMTQLFYDTSKFVAFEKLLREHSSGVFRTIPIIPGLLPISTYQSFIRTAKLSNAHIPDDLLERINAVPYADDEQVKQVGVSVLTEMIDRIHRETDRRVKGFHFYTLNLEKSVALIIEQSPIIKTPLKATIDDAAATATADRAFTLAVSPTTAPVSVLAAPTVSIESAEDISKVADHVGSLDLTDKAATVVVSDPTKQLLSPEATWDDFPNGRWGDPRSPAYGEIDGYGPTLHVPASKALELWGSPESAADISSLFIRYLTGDLPVLPWSEQSGLNPETDLIREDLISLNTEGLWTVASQPAVSGARSDDKVFGWGPSNGYVFQKAMIEFFISGEKWAILKKKLQDSTSDIISYYAGNDKGDFFSNMSLNDVNAVTWGVFPNREVVQPTIIEEQSFKAWMEEAFGIWSEWEFIYPKKSATSNLLRSIRQNYYLVSIVHHDYMSGEALWKFLQL